MTLTDTDKNRAIESHSMLQDLTAVVRQIQSKQETIEAKVDRIEKRAHGWVRVWMWARDSWLTAAGKIKDIKIDE